MNTKITLAIATIAGAALITIDRLIENGHKAFAIEQIKT